MSLDIDRPTLLLNVERVKENIRRMADKAHSQGIRFRPHFKTHQSAAIGEWFREVGVSAITVSSVEMAQYFARHGWNDIIIAFPANLRQISTLNELARSVHLGLLVESPETVDCLREQLASAVDVWIEIDDGTNRSGISWENPQPALELARALQSNQYLNLKGLLAHAGRIYQAASPTEIRRIYLETADRVNSVRQFMSAGGFPVEVSIGDTPGCTLSPNLGAVDEIRPGNFVFYDAMQLVMGVCQLQDIAAVVVCPVVARYPERSEVVIYGGAVHLSKDTVAVDGRKWFGLVGVLNDAPGAEPDQWLSWVQGGYVARLTQEHGVVKLPEPALNQVKVGSLLTVIPAHVCLTVSALGEYTTVAGQSIQTLNREM